MYMRGACQGRGYASTNAVVACVAFEVSQPMLECLRCTYVAFDSARRWLRCAFGILSYTARRYPGPSYGRSVTERPRPRLSSRSPEPSLPSAYGPLASTAPANLGRMKRKRVHTERYQESTASGLIPELLEAHRRECDGEI